jgi:hypothetical protein
MIQSEGSEISGLFKDPVNGIHVLRKGVVASLGHLPVNLIREALFMNLRGSFGKILHIDPNHLKGQVEGPIEELGLRLQRFT